MSDPNISIGDIIVDKETGQRYRLITVIGRENIILCKMDTGIFDLSAYPYDNVIRLLCEGTLTAEKDEPVIFDPDSLSEKAREDYWNKQKMMNEVLEAYGPDYLELCGRKQKPELESILKKYSISGQIFRRICTRFFQNGMQTYTLADYRTHGSNRGREYHQKKKSGRKSEYFPDQGIPADDEVKGYFDEALKAFLSNRSMTVNDAYNQMNYLHYCYEGTLNLLPASQRPTFKQFYYYIHKHTTESEIAVKKTSQQEVRNNQRLLKGDAQNDVHGPGDMVEIDACEVDAAVVSLLDVDQSVGRPVVYFMIDVATRIILAISVSFDNNSNRALSNLMLNLCDDKQEYCAKYGINFTDSRLWPSNIIPTRMRCDKGSDFMSNQFSDFCIANGIERQNVTAASGSLKGIVEQSFHQLHANINVHLEHNGLITKRHDSKHHREATLTIENYTAMVINFVLQHNQHYLEDYPLTSDMIKKEILPVPVQLWQYGIAKYGSPRPIRNLEDYLYSLMKPVDAKLSRKGIVFKGLVYQPEDDPELDEKMFRAGKKSKVLKVKIDDRCIDAVYYVRDGRMYRAPLNEQIQGNADFKNFTLYSWEKYRKLRGQMDAQGRILNEEEAAYFYAMQESIVNSAKKPNYSSDKNIRAAKTLDKEKIAADNRIEDRLPGNFAGSVPALTDQKDKPEEKPEGQKEKKYKNLEDAFNHFDDDF